MSEGSNEVQLLIEIPESEQGIVEASLSPAELAQLSMNAIDNAMVAIRYMGAKVRAATDDLDMQEAEVSFGLKFGAEGSIPFISKASGEGHLSVKLTWKKSQANTG